MPGNCNSKYRFSNLFIKTYLTTWISHVKFDQSLPLIYVLVLVISKFHKKLQLKFQSSNVRYDWGRVDSAMVHDCKTQMIQNIQSCFLFLQFKGKTLILTHFSVL